MRHAAFTVDVDRDVNEPRPGQLEACTRNCPAPRFTSTAQGLVLLVDLLNELGIRGTFFLEGETVERWPGEGSIAEILDGHEIASHGYAHEDLTGESTGIAPSPDWLDAIIGRSVAVIEDAVGRRPVGFRAPYQHINEQVTTVLAGRGLRYDSTHFADVAGGLRPYRLPSGLLEIPLAQGTDRQGKRMQSYLWPLHEGKRPVADYLHLLSRSDEGLLVLGDHSWHMVESLNGPRSARQVIEEVDRTRQVLQGALDQGLAFMTLEDYVRLED
jgi:peptidoglycan/xylan/chitin deacetylase (PgdA/CDA1 family)